MFKENAAKSPNLPILSLILLPNSTIVKNDNFIFAILITGPRANLLLISKFIIENQLYD